MILGRGGAGKSELAVAISRRTGLPVVHLDHVFWRPGWKPAPPEESARDMVAAVAGERWILDGNFLGGEGGERRFERADMVVFLDLPRRTCLWRVLRRLVRGHWRSRPDLPAGCSESLDLAFLRWIWRYPRHDRPSVLQLLAGLDAQVDVGRLRTCADVRRFMEAL